MKMSCKFRKTLIATAVLTVAALTIVAASEGPKWIGAFFVKGRVGLKWQAMEGVAEYTIYRKTGSGEFEKFATTEKTQHFDTDLIPGKIYTYKIIVQSADGSELVSGEKKVTIPGAKADEFAPPKWSGVRYNRNKVLLRWDVVPGAIAYNIYRSTTSGSGYEVVGNATVQQHADGENQEQGNTYYYVVTALNEEFEETEFSEERSVVFGLSAEELKAQEEAAKIVLEDVPLTFLFDITKAGGNKDMNQPADVFVNSQGNIYITDALNFQVNCYDNSGTYLFSFGEKTPSDMMDNPPTSTFSYPFTLYIDKSDNVYVTDVKNGDIQVFTADGKFTRRIRVAVDDGMEQFRPNGLVVLDDGRMVATDAGNHRFVILDNDGKVLLSKGSRGAENGQFIFPDELTVTDDGVICVVDVINCRIQEFDMDGNFIRAFGHAGQTAGMFGRPKALTLDNKGRVWVSDAMAHIVQIFTLEGEVKSAITTFENEDVFLATPRGMFIKDGRFYVVNRLPHRLLVFQIG
jgi:sugar lactone lactonase YvrE